MLTIVLLTGAEGAGKSSIATTLVTNHGFYELSFATGVRAATVEVWNTLCAMVSPSLKLPTISIADTYDRDKKELPLPCDIDLRIGGRIVSPRVLLQWFGTDIMRTKVADDIWVNTTLSSLTNLIQCGHTKFVLSDLRFPNELTAVRTFAYMQGGQIIAVRVKRTHTDEHVLACAGHESTQHWASLPVDIELCNTFHTEWLPIAAKAILDLVK